MFKLTASREILLIAAASLLSSPPTLAAARGIVWKTYSNQAAHFAVRYPASWTPGARTRADKAIVVAFEPRSGPAITITERAALPDDADRLSQPNPACRSVKAGKLAGLQCIDALGSLSTTVLTRSRVYIIAMPLRRVSRAVYDRMLRSFRLVG